MSAKRDHKPHALTRPLTVVNARSRTALAVLLVLGGLALTGFYYLLFAITDCASGCVAAGERAVPLAFVGAGIGLATAGFRLRAGARRASGTGLVTAGAVGALAIAWIIVSEGSRGQAIWLLGLMLAFALAGAFLLAPWRRPRVGSPI